MKFSYGGGMKANLNGLDVYYEIHGDKEPLVLIAGFACRTNHWDLIIEELAKNFKVLIFDNRGVGQSATPDESYTVEQMAHDTLLLMEHVGISSAHILGHSMGGCIGQVIAAKYPQRVKKLVLSNSLRKMNRVSVLTQRVMLHLREEKVAMPLIVEAVLPWLFSSTFLSLPGIVDMLIELMIKNPYPQSILGYKRQLEALAGFNSTEWISTIQVPTLVIGGDEDLLCPHEAEKMAESLPNVIFKNMGKIAHVPMVEQPAAFNQIVLDFLK